MTELYFESLLIDDNHLLYSNSNVCNEMIKLPGRTLFDNIPNNIETIIIKNIFIVTPKIEMMKDIFNNLPSSLREIRIISTRSPDDSIIFFRKIFRVPFGCVITVMPYDFNSSWNAGYNKTKNL